MTLTSLKYLTVVSKNNLRKLQGLMHHTNSPRVLGKVFSNSLAKSGSFKRAFISEITFYQPHSRESIQSQSGDPIDHPHLHRRTIERPTRGCRPHKGQFQCARGDVTLWRLRHNFNTRNLSTTQTPSPVRKSYNPDIELPPNFRQLRLYSEKAVRTAF